MTTFEHQTTGARATYPEGHRLHALLTSSEYWHPVEEPRTRDQEDDGERPSPARGRGRRATTAAD